MFVCFFFPSESKFVPQLFDWHLNASSSGGLCMVRPLGGSINNLLLTRDVLWWCGRTVLNLILMWVLETFWSAFDFSSRASKNVWLFDMWRIKSCLVCSPPSCLHCLTSDPWHRQGISLHTGNILRQPLKWSCQIKKKIPLAVVFETLQPSSSFWCSLWTSASRLRHV